MSGSGRGSLPLRTIIGPALVSSLCLAFGLGFITLGYCLWKDVPHPIEASVFGSGVGFVLGFWFGSMVWVGRIIPQEQKAATQRFSHEDVPPPMPQSIEVWDTPKSGQFVDIPEKLTLQMLQETARLMVGNNYMISHSLGGPGSPLSRDQYEAFRNMLLKHEYAAWRGATPQLGLRITSTGRNFIYGLATHAGDDDVPEEVFSLLHAQHTHKDT